MLKKHFLTLLVLTTSYLIFSIPFVYSYAVGEYLDPGKRIKASIFEPRLEILDDLKPISCESTGYLDFRMIMENLPPNSSIAGIEAYVNDLSYTGRSYDVTPSVSCSPTRNLISNEEISCRLEIRELLYRIPACPMERIDNMLDVYLDVQTGAGQKRVYGSGRIVITDSGIMPELKIDFQATYPPHPKPNINCLTGSIVDIPVVLGHTEVFYGKTEWMLRINNSQEFRELIECELVSEGEFRPEGKSDIHMCLLTIPSTFFPACGSGPLSLEILARNGDYTVSDSFETTTFSQPLNLGLSLGEIQTIECKIVNEEGLCYPVNPQQNISVAITGNVPKYLESFDFSYTLGDGNETGTYCRRMRYNLYECMIFVTKDALPFPSGSGTSRSSRDLNFSMQIKHINYYQGLSETMKIGMEGRAIHDFLSAKNALEEKKRQLEKANEWKEGFEKAAYWIDFISLCCKLVVLEKQLNDIRWLNQMSQLYGKTLPGVLGTTFSGIAESTGSFLKAVGKFGDGLFIALKVVQGETLSILMSAGPGIIGCIGEAAMNAVDIEIENIESFESGSINSELEVPLNVLDYLKSLVGCFGEKLWDTISARWKGYLCMVATFLLSKTPAAGAVNFLCKVITTLSGPLKIMVTLALLIANAVVMNISIGIATEAIAVAREEINIHVKREKAVIDYMEYMRNTLLAIATAQVTSQAYDLLKPELTADQASLFFVSGRTGLLDYDGEVCRGDSLTIKYNFEKLNLTEDFVSQLRITNTARAFARTLAFTNLKDEYGPYSADGIFRIDPNNNPSSHYTFTLSFTMEGVPQEIGYRLYYNNQTCI